MIADLTLKAENYKEVIGLLKACLKACYRNPQALISTHVTQREKCPRHKRFHKPFDTFESSVRSSKTIKY